MSEPSDSFFGLHFSERQNRIVTASVTWVLLLVGVVALGRFLGAVRDFIGHHSNVLLPPVIGIILAMIVKPVYNVVERLFRGRRLPAVAVTTIIVFIPVVAFLWFCGDLLVSQGLRFLDAAPDLYRQAAGYIARKTPAATALIDRFGLAFLLNGDRLEELMKTYLPKVLAPAGDTAVSIGSYLVGKTVALLGWIVLPVYTAFFLATRPLGGKDVEKLLVFTTPRTRGNVAYLVDQFLDIVVASSAARSSSSSSRAFSTASASSWPASPTGSSSASSSACSTSCPTSATSSASASRSRWRGSVRAEAWRACAGCWASSSRSTRSTPISSRRA